jgi:MSHA pilin protein MshC
VSVAKGFSAVELVVVLVIAAILAALALPRFTDSESKATWFREEMKAAIRYAQRQAVAQKRCVFVDVTATQVKLLYGDATCSGIGPSLKFLATAAAGKSPGDAYILDAPTGVTLSPTGNFFFNGLGQPSGAVSLNVGGKTIAVTAETGYVLEP